MATATAEKKRTKTVFDRDELAHVWAHQKAPYGRAKSTNMYFEGPTIYSYGSHFPMARLLLDPKTKKPRAVLVTTRTYSNTTSKHQGDVRSAVSHLPQFHVHDVTQTKHAVNLNYYRREIARLVETVEKGKSQTRWHLRSLDNEIREANRYAEFFKLATRFAYPEGFDRAAQEAKADAEEEKARVRAEKREERDRERNAAALAKAQAEYEAKKAEYEPKLAAWLAGEGDRFPPLPIALGTSWYVQDEMRRQQGVRMRVRNSRIETSLGAVFNIEAAKPLLALCRRPAAGVASFPDVEVDGYSGVTIDYDKKTVKVGCHTVTFDEVERIARQLGL